jgi:hypothetical protein
VWDYVIWISANANATEMIASRSHKFIFLSNPKCASSTIRGLLHNRCEVTAKKILDRARKEADLTDPANPAGSLVRNAVNLLHITAHQLKGSFYRSKIKGGGEHSLNWEDYYSFGTVRNPFKKMVSWYFFLQPDKNFKTILDINTKDGYDVDTAYHHHFNDFVNYLTENEYKSLPNHDYFFTDWDSGELLVNDIFKVEDINEIFPKKFKEATGIELKTPLPNVMPDFQVAEQSRYVKFKGNPYELYNDDSRQYVEERFASDIDKFDYSFGS